MPSAKAARRRAGMAMRFFASSVHSYSPTRTGRCMARHFTPLFPTMQHIFCDPSPLAHTVGGACARGRDERGRRVRDHEVRGEQRLQRSMQRGGRACRAARCRRRRRSGAALRRRREWRRGAALRRRDGQLLPGLERREVGVRIELLDLDDRDPEARGDARERVAGLDDVDLRLARARGLGARRGARSRAGLGARRRRLARLGRLRGRLARLRRRRVAGSPRRRRRRTGRRARRRR